MDTNPDDFGDIQKLLALKRHEQPPPRYFNEFSGQVIARLRTPELLPQPTWLQRLGLDFDFRPAMVCAMGVVVSGLMLAAAILSVQVEATATTAIQPIGTAPMEMDVAWNSGPVFASSRSTVDHFPASTLPVFTSPSSSPFSHFAVQASPVSWSFGKLQN